MFTGKDRVIEMAYSIFDCIKQYSFSVNSTIIADYCRQADKRQTDKMLLPIAASSKRGDDLSIKCQERFHRHLNQTNCPTFVEKLSRVTSSVSEMSEQFTKQFLTADVDSIRNGLIFIKESIRIISTLYIFQLQKYRVSKES